MSYIGYYEDCCDSSKDTVTNTYNIEEKFFDFTAEKFNYYSINTLNEPVNVILPSGSNIQNGEWIGFIDSVGNFGINNLTIRYNGSDRIRNNSGDLIVDLNYINFKLVYNNGNWNVLDMSITSVTGDSIGTGGGLINSKFDLIVVNSDFNAVTSKLYAVNTTNNIVNVALPTNVVNGDWIDFVDNAGKFGTNKLILNYNGYHSIRNNNGNLEVDLNFVNFRMIFNDNNWSLLDMSVSGSIGNTGSIDYNFELSIDQLNQVLNYTKSNDNYLVYEGSGTVNIIKNSYYLINTSSAIATINLPSNPVNGDWLIISDKNKTFGINKAVLKYASPRTIAQNSDDIELDINGTKIKLVFYNNNWDILSLS